MNRGLRTLVIVLVIIAAIAGLGYAAHSLDLVGMIVRLHSAPAH
jgi:hypothetical protein